VAVSSSSDAALQMQLFRCSSSNAEWLSSSSDAGSRTPRSTASHKRDVQSGCEQLFRCSSSDAAFQMQLFKCRMVEQLFRCRVSHASLNGFSQARRAECRVAVSSSSDAGSLSIGTLAVFAQWQPAHDKPCLLQQASSQELKHFIASIPTSLTQRLHTRTNNDIQQTCTSNDIHAQNMTCNKHA